MKRFRLFLAVAFALFAPPLAAQQEYIAQLTQQFEGMAATFAESGLYPDLEMLSGSLAAGASERVSITLQAGVTYKIVGVCDADCSDVDLVLYAGKGAAVDEDRLEDDVPILDATPASTTTYSIEVLMITCSSEPCFWGVRAFSARGQRATSQGGGAAQTASGGPLSGGPLSGTSSAGLRRESGRLERGDATLTSGEFTDQYTFNGTAGEEVIVDLRSSDFDPYVMVLGPNESRQENDDYEGDVNRALVRFTLPATGEYRVAVTSYASGESGGYDLTIQQGLGAAASTAPIAERGSLATGDATLTSGEYVDEFTFQGSPGERVRVDLRSSDFDTYVMLLGPGEFRHENDDADDGVGHSALEADLTDGGEYRVLVTSYAPSETGAYDLTIERGVVAATAQGQRDVERLQLGQSAAGTLADGDGVLESGEYRDTWVFDGQAGQDVSFEVASNEFDPYLLLVSPDGDVIDENDDADGRTDLSRVSARLPQTGRYRVVATSYAAGQTGRYQVSANGAAAAVASGAAARASSAAGAGVGQVYGVFVGISDYGGRASDLAYTADDARHAADAMVQGAGMDRANSIVLTDREATVANVRAAFEEMGRKVGPNDTFVYFYSGHGSRVPRNGPEQSDPDALDETVELFDAGIRDNEMSDLLGLVNANLSMLILDSCFSGGFSKDAINTPGRIGFFSSEEDVTSQVAAKFRAGGYLAQFVFDGVGERLADGDRDGAISAIELSQYIHERYRADVKSSGPGDYVRTGGPQSGFQHFVADRGSIGPDQIIFR